ncbi:PREDICTED: uncharacterized protein LOC107345063 [Acropora digitifera]|uniref:uncharacterized protein LOC107345063 n=1 Tax=Acropora digitifera TaxID=70779 RepID=UPI00077A28A1|nr:PREDICTED: uncharacterized protein LOC107345063 [Acropora digitifera]XP_015766237.1 PREDICTED: uncharacterized protein LOC107345063 [Acropora digitifera]XP_015766238.1 PREDICTED: uncharacterized protein LOC107345063 [Acropora digitifera]
MAQNAGNFTLRFQQELGTDQLVRSGGKHDPLDRELRAVREDQYGKLMTSPNEPNTKVRKVFDFLIDTQGRIYPKKSPGFSTYTDEESLKKRFKIKKDRLWKLDKVINGETLMYPIEVTISRDEDNDNHFVMKPGVPVRLEIFRQMLRCLPWLKMY